ncbi:hypothetical protein [Amycolatopsis alba]|uniref:hypothetical protein n=1 Tax=Amycolatopsis alba TaxID=76020 RepID=UPI00036B5F29|nr:hypothetical protein [Amycolatopsis alba]
MKQGSEDDAERRENDPRRYPTKWQKLTRSGSVVILANQLVDFSEALIRLMNH